MRARNYVGIYPFANAPPVISAAGIRHYDAVAATGLRCKIRRVIFLISANKLPLPQKRKTNALHRVAPQPQSCVLPITVHTFLIYVFVGKITSARIRRFSVHNHNFSVVAQVKRKGKPRNDSVEKFKF